MNRDFYTKHEINETLNGLSFEKISQLEFDNLQTKNPNTIYYVYDDKGNVTQYIGGAELSSGKLNIGNAALVTETVTGIIKNATFEEV